VAAERRTGVTTGCETRTDRTQGGEKPVDMFELAVHGSVGTPAVHGRQLGVHRSGTPLWGSIYGLRRAVLHLVHTIYRGYDSGDGMVGKELQRTDSGSVRMWAADRQGAAKPVLVIGRGVER
jgi:hypothetical protein